MQINMQFTESRSTKSFGSYKHLFLSRLFPEWPQRVQQTWKKNDLEASSHSAILEITNRMFLGQYHLIFMYRTHHDVKNRWMWSSL